MMKTLSLPNEKRMVQDKERDENEKNSWIKSEDNRIEVEHSYARDEKV